jgi:hypothetical protein
MSWQEKAVEAAYLGYMEAAKSTDSLRERFEAALRAALPLIEVTPGMERAVGYALGSQARLKTMLRACAEEKP